MRVGLDRDPRVIRMADYLAADRAFMDWLTDPVRRTCSASAYEHVTRNVTVALCVTGLLVTWGAAREQGDRVGDDLVIEHCDLDTLSAIANVPSFGDALASVGWAAEGGDSVMLPKFFKDNESPDDRHKRQAAERQARFRAKQAEESNVTDNVTVTPREEKRREEEKKEKRAPGKAKACTLTDWIAELGDSDAVPADDPIFEWAGKVGIPRDWIALAWWVFEGRYTGDGQGRAKTYTDWRATFRNAVREDWLKLWRAGPDGYFLTTAGQQAQREMRA